MNKYFEKRKNIDDLNTDNLKYSPNKSASFFIESVSIERFKYDSNGKNGILNKTLS